MPVASDLIGQYLYQKLIQPREDEHQKKLYGDALQRKLVDEELQKRINNNDTQGVQQIFGSSIGKKYYKDEDANNEILKAIESNRQAATYAAVITQTFQSQGGITSETARKNFGMALTTGLQKGLMTPADVAAGSALLALTPEQMKTMVSTAKEAKQTAALPTQDEAQAQRKATLGATEALKGQREASAAHMEAETNLIKDPEKLIAQKAAISGATTTARLASAQKFHEASPLLESGVKVQAIDLNTGKDVSDKLTLGQAEKQAADGKIALVPPQMVGDIKRGHFLLSDVAQFRALIPKLFPKRGTTPPPVNWAKVQYKTYTGQTAANLYEAHRAVDPIAFIRAAQGRYPSMVEYHAVRADAFPDPMRDTQESANAKLDNIEGSLRAMFGDASAAGTTEIRSSNARLNAATLGAANVEVNTPETPPAEGGEGSTPTPDYEEVK